LPELGNLPFGQIVNTATAQESIAAANDIESRQSELGRLKGIGAELMKREISRCDHMKFIEAQDKLGELRKEPFGLVEPIFKRLVKSLDDELNQVARDAEQRLDAAGLSVRNGDFMDGARRRDMQSDLVLSPHCGADLIRAYAR
jgi:hypothetical protein